MPEKGTVHVKVIGDLKDLKREIGGIGREPFKLKLDDKGFSQPLGRITGKLGEFDKSLEASNARVIAFGASAGAIMGVQRALKATVTAAIEVEKSLSDINVILGAGEKNLARFGDQLFKIAANTGQSFKVVANAATELARQGLSVEETLRRTSDALVLTRLSGLDAVASVESLTASINSFNKVALTSTEIVNKLANVDAAFAVSSADLAEALRRVGSTASDAGVSFDQLVAAVTSAQQVTARGGSVIGNSFKTIFTRLQRPAVLQQLEQLGIKTKGLGDSARPVIGILTDLAKVYDRLASSQRAQISELIGGVFQINIVKAALSDLGKEYSIYDRALATSVSSTNEAIARNEQLNKTLSALINKTFANLQKTGARVGEGAFGPAIKNVLGFVNKALGDSAGEKGAEDFGGRIAQGIFKGLGDFLSGPGLVLGASLMLKMFSRLTVTLTDAFRTIAQQNKQTALKVQLEKQAFDWLSRHPDILQKIKNGTMSIVDAERHVAESIRLSTKELNQQYLVVKSIVGGLMASKNLSLGAGVGASKTGEGGITTKGASGGLVPTRRERQMEKSTAAGLGYAAGGIKADNIKGVGRVVYNSNEDRVQFAGMSSEAIMPPKSSKAGRNYRKGFRGKHGFDPYRAAGEMMAGGMVPNFSRNYTVKDIARLSPIVESYIKGGRGARGKMDRGEWYGKQPMKGYKPTKEGSPYPLGQKGIESFHEQFPKAGGKFWDSMDRSSRGFVGFDHDDSFSFSTSYKPINLDSKHVKNFFKGKRGKKRDIFEQYVAQKISNTAGMGRASTASVSNAPLDVIEQRAGRISGHEVKWMYNPSGVIQKTMGGVSGSMMATPDYYAGKALSFGVQLGKFGFEGKKPFQQGVAEPGRLGNLNIYHAKAGTGLDWAGLAPQGANLPRAGAKQRRKVSRAGFASGYVPNFARYVFDKDAYLQKYADKGLLQSRLDETGTGSLKELFDYDVTQAGKKSNLTVINAAAGAGKTSLAMGSKKRGKLAFSSKGISKRDQSVVVRATESITAGKDALLNRMYAPYAKRYLSLLPGGEAIQEGRRSRGQTGQYMFGRSAKQTSGAGVDFLAQAAVLQDAVGGKHRTLTRGAGENQPWKRYGSALPKVHTRPIAATTGAFSPFTLGHQKLLNKMQKTGMPTVASVAGGKNRESDIGLSIGRKMQLIQGANPQTAVVGGGKTPQIFTAPADMPKLGIKKGDVISSTPEGSLTFLGTDRFQDSKTGKRGIFDLREVKRSAGDISATKVRSAIKSGDVGSYSKMLPKNVGDFVTGNLGDIQAMQGMMSQREAKKMGGITSRLGALWGEMGVPFDPSGRSPVLSPKRKKEFPVQAAEIADLNAKRKRAVSHKWRKRVFPHLGGGLIPNFASKSDSQIFQDITQKLARGSIQGFNNIRYEAVLAQNPQLMAAYQELKAGAAGRGQARSAKTAGIDAQVAKTYAGKGAKAVFLQNLKEPTVARRLPSTLRHGFDPDILPGVRNTFMGSLNNRWEKLIRGVAFDTFSTIPPNKLKSFGGMRKLMSGLETRGLTQIPVTMGPVKGRVFEEFINAMSPVVNRRAHETGSERIDLGNRRIKGQYRGLFTPGMPGTGAEIRAGSLSEKKAKQKFGLAGGFIPNFAKGGGIPTMLKSSASDAVMSYITGSTMGLPLAAFAADMLAIHGPEAVKGAIRMAKGGSFFKGYGKGSRLESGGLGGAVPGFHAGGKIPSDLNIGGYNKMKWRGGSPPGRAEANKKRKLAELERALKEAIRLSKPYKRSADAKPWTWDAAGIIPNFSNPLADAFTRERAAGVPTSKIRIGASPRLASGLNPSGLGVYNTIDEPGGLSQGINRSRAQGLNPKSAGVPNFATPLHPLLPPTGGASGKEAAAKVKKGMKEVSEALAETTDTLEDLADAGKVGGFEAFQNKALQASFLLPMVSGQLQSFVGTTSKAGKALGGLTDGVSIAASFVGVGGPWGLAVGAAIGSFIALDKGLKAFNSNSEELRLKSSKLTESFTKASNGLASYGDALQQYRTAIKDASSSASLIVRLQDKMADALRDVPSAFQDQVLAARNSTDLQEKVADGLKELAKEAAQAKFASSLEQITEGERTGFAMSAQRGWFGKIAGLGLTDFDVDVFEEIRGSAKKFASDFRGTVDFNKLSAAIVDQGALVGNQEEIIRRLETQFGISGDQAFGLRDMSSQDFGEFSSNLFMMAQATALTNEKTEAAAEIQKKFKSAIEEQTLKIANLEKEFQGLIQASKFMAETFSQQRKFMDDFNAAGRKFGREGSINNVRRALQVSSPFMTEQAIAANQTQMNLAGIRSKTIGGQDKIVSSAARERSQAVIKLEGAFLKAIESQAIREGLKEGQVTKDPAKQQAITAFRTELQDIVRRRGREGKPISKTEVDNLQQLLAGTGVAATGELNNEFITAQNEILNANIKQTQSLAELKQSNDEQLKQARKDYEAQLKQIRISQDIAAAGGAEGFASGVGDSIMQEMADAQAGMMLGRKMGSIGVMGRGATMAEMSIQRATGAPSGNEWLRNVATRGRQAQLGGMFGLMGIRGQDTGRMARNQMDALFKPGRGILPETKAAMEATKVDYSMMNAAHKLALDESEGLLASIDNKMTHFSKAAQDMLGQRAQAALALHGTGRDKDGNIIEGQKPGILQQMSDAIKQGLAEVERGHAMETGKTLIEQFNQQSKVDRRHELIDKTMDWRGHDEHRGFDAIINDVINDIYDQESDKFRKITKQQAGDHPAFGVTEDGKFKNVGVKDLASLNNKLINMWDAMADDSQTMSEDLQRFHNSLPEQYRNVDFRAQWEDAFSDMGEAAAETTRNEIDEMLRSISKYIDSEAKRINLSKAGGFLPEGREMEKRMLKGNRQYSASEAARATPQRRNINGKPTWLNSEEMVLPNFAGSGKQAVLTPAMARGFGMSNGYIPNFQDVEPWYQQKNQPNIPPKSSGLHPSDMEPFLWGGAGAGASWAAWRYRSSIGTGVGKVIPTGMLERRAMLKELRKKLLVGNKEQFKAGKVPEFTKKEFKNLKEVVKAIDYAERKGLPIRSGPAVPWGGDALDTGGGNTTELRGRIFDNEGSNSDRIKAIKELLNDDSLHKNINQVKKANKTPLMKRLPWFERGGQPPKTDTLSIKGVGETTEELIKAEKAKQAALQRMIEEARKNKADAAKFNTISTVSDNPFLDRGPTRMERLAQWSKGSSLGTAGKGLTKFGALFDPATATRLNPNLLPTTPPSSPTLGPSAPKTNPNLLERAGSFVAQQWSRMPSWMQTSGRVATRAAAPFRHALPVIGGAGQVGLVSETATGSGGFAKAQQQLYGTSVGEPNPVFKLFGIDTPGFDLGGNVAGSGASTSFATEEERIKYFQSSEFMKASRMLQARVDMLMKPTRNYGAANFSEEERGFYNQYVQKETEKLRSWFDHNMHGSDSVFHRMYGVTDSQADPKRHDAFLNNNKNLERYWKLKSRLKKAGLADGFIPNFADEGKINKMLDISMFQPISHSFNSSGKPGHHRTFNLKDVKNWENIAMDVGANMGIAPPMMKNYLSGIGATKIGIFGNKNEKYNVKGAYHATSDMISMGADKVQSLLNGSPGGIATLSNELTHVIQDRFMAQHPDISVQGAVGNLKSSAAADKLATGGGKYQEKVDGSIQALEKRWKNAISTHGLKLDGDKMWWLDRAGNQLFRAVISGGAGPVYQEGDMGFVSGPYGWAKGETKLEWQSTLNAYLAELKARYGERGYANGYLPNFALQGRPSSMIGGGSFALSGVNMGLGWFNNPFYKNIAMNTPGLAGLMNPSGFGRARSWSNRGAYGAGNAANGLIPSIRASQNRERKATGRSDVYTKYVNTPNFSGFATFNGSERGREKAIVKAHPSPRSAGMTPNFAGDASDVKNAIDSLSNQISLLAEQIRSAEQQGQAEQGGSHQLAMSPLNVNVNHSGKLTTEIAAIQNQISLAIENAMKQIAPALWSTIKGPSTV